MAAAATARWIIALAVLGPLLSAAAAAAAAALQQEQQPDGPQFARKVVVRRKCNYDSDCATNAYCRQQTECTCKDGFFVVRNEDTKDEHCLKWADQLGDLCEESEQCHFRLGLAAECHGATCQCTAWAHPVGGVCYNTSRVGEACHSERNCRIEGDVPLSCDRGRCACPRLQHGSADGKRCLDTRWLSQECWEDEQCRSNNSRCLGGAGSGECAPDNQCVGVCACEIRFVPNAASRRCLPVAGRVGEPCEEQQQCNAFVGNAECGADGRCFCPEGYHAGQFGEHCWRTVYLGEGCGRDEECLATPPGADAALNVTRALCVDGWCRCAPGFHEDALRRYCTDSSAVSMRPAVLLVAALAVALFAIKA